MHSRTIAITLLALGLVAVAGQRASAQDWESGDPGAAEPSAEPQQQQTGGGYEGGGGGAAGGAEVSTGGVETMYAQRGITLSQGTLRIDSGPYERSMNNSGSILGTFSYGAHGIRVVHAEFTDPFTGEDFGDTSTAWGIGVAYGILDELEVGALLLPIILEPGDFGDMALYGRYAFLRSDVFELGAQLAFSFPTGGTETFGIGVGLPFSVRLIERLRIEGAVEFEALINDFDDQTSLDIPVAVSYNVLDPLFVGVQTGLFIPDFDEVVWPIGPFVGYTLALEPVAIDFTGAFTGFVNDALPVNWELVFGVNVHLGLAGS